MSQESTSASSAPGTPVGLGSYAAGGPAAVDFRTVDSWPAGSAAAKALVDGDPAARIAVYVRSMRTMMIFFVVVTVLALTAAVILGIVDIAAIHSLRQQQTTLPGSY